MLFKYQNLFKPFLFSNYSNILFMNGGDCQPACLHFLCGVRVLCEAEELLLLCSGL